MRKVDRLAREGFGYEGPEGLFYSDKVALVYTREEKGEKGWWGPYQYPLDRIEKVIETNGQEDGAFESAELALAIGAAKGGHTYRPHWHGIPTYVHMAGGKAVVAQDVERKEEVLIESGFLARVWDIRHVRKGECEEVLFNGYYMKEFPPVVEEGKMRMGVNAHSVFYRSTVGKTEYHVIVHRMDDEKLVEMLRGQL